MPWTVVPDHAECGDGKFAVVKDDGGEVEACHATREAADDHVKALYANDGGGSMPKRAYAASLRGLELARPGTYKLQSGPMTFTDKMLADAARWYAASGGRPAPVSRSHRQAVHARRRRAGVGLAVNLSYETDDDGPVLRGDIEDMPEWLAAAAPKHWPNRSVEGWADYSDGEDTYAFIVDGLSSLAPPHPASPASSLRDLPAALGVAASARVVASFGNPQTTVSEAEEEPPTNDKEADGMKPDPAKIREALGLPDCASDEEVRAGLAEAGYAPPTPPKRRSRSPPRHRRRRRPARWSSTSGVGWERSTSSGSRPPGPPPGRRA